MDTHRADTGAGYITLKNQRISINEYLEMSSAFSSYSPTYNCDVLGFSYSYDRTLESLSLSSSTTDDRSVRVHTRLRGKLPNPDESGYQNGRKGLRKKRISW